MDGERIFESFFGTPATDPKRTHDPKALTLIVVRIPDADVKGANPHFFLSINFGAIANANQYNVQLFPDSTASGTGTTTLTAHGKDVTVAFNVKTAAGIAYHGTLECTGALRY